MNIYDIAKLAGVSKSTVSRVINGHTGVSEKTRIIVEKAIDEFAYIPNNSARSLSSLYTDTVVLMVCGITNPFFSKIISLILEKMYEHQTSVSLHSFDPGFDANIVDAAVSICKEKRPRGIILLGGIFEENHHLLKLINVPIVMVTTTVYSTKDKTWFSSVRIDDGKEGEKVAEFVCENGHRKIAVIGDHYFREAGMSKIFNKFGVNVKKIKLDIDRAYSFCSGEKAAMKLLEKESYTCLVCLSDVLAIGALKAAKTKRLSIPEDISIIGFDGIENGAFTNPMLSTFVQPFEEIVEKSVSTLMGIIEGKSFHKHYVLQTKFELGESFCARR